MARTILLYVVPAVLVASAWMRLETGPNDPRVVGLCLLALLPALPRPAWARALASVVAVVVGVRVALGVSPLDARPFDSRHEFFGPLFERFGRGVLDFYEVAQPFRAAQHPAMHDVVLLAIFAFALVIALALAAGRPLLAAFALVAGSMWPATLVSGSDLARGAVTLGVVLGLLAACRSRPAPGYRAPALAAVALVAASFAASTSPAIAKDEFVAWKAWDFYDAPADPVGVEYVWDGRYTGVRFPKEKTVVLEILAPRNARYWRATTLDVFREDRWVEVLYERTRGAGRTALYDDPAYPPAAENVNNWVRSEVEVEALQDLRLVGGSMPVQFDPQELGLVHYLTGNVAVADAPIERGDNYSVWSYAPQATPEQLARARPGAVARPRLMRRYLEVAPGARVPAFRARGRGREVRTLFRDPLVGQYEPLYRAAERVTRGTRTQYAAVVALEAWFRSEGGFLYEERPPQSAGPPLVDFVARTKRGYCQHFAGAMTLMLRYLGIPARVGAGFTTGSYDADEGRWTVTDHDAHTWVEVWFPGYGWLPFDPTPSRGTLSGAYTTASRTFDTRGAATVLGAGIFADRAGSVAEALARKYATEGTNLRGDRPGDLEGLPALPDRPDASLLRVLAFVAAVLVAGMALLKLALRRSRYLSRDPRRLAGACRQELVDFLADQGLAVPRSATTAEVGALLRRQLAVDARAFVRAADVARFSPPDEAAEAAREARRELRSVLRHVRRRLGVARRLRGTVSLRSLAA